MAWIEVHDNLPDHPKVIDLADLLNMDKDAVVGKLIRLWTWALNSREDGYLRAQDATTVADVMRVKLKPAALIVALVEVGFLDPADGGYRIHDWDEHVSRLMELRERRRSQARERKQRQRAKERDGHADVTRDTEHQNPACHAATVPKPNQEDEDDTISSPWSAGAREDIHRLSTFEVEKAFREKVGRAPSPAESEFLLGVPESSELVLEAIRRAAVNGAQSVTAYAGTALAQWARAGIGTVEQLEAWEAEWRDPFAALE